MSSGKSFKDTYGATSTFNAGYLPPEKILIVGIDVPIEDWNEDLWDQARIDYAKNHPIDPNDLIQVIEMGGSIPAVVVVKRRDMVLTVEGRRRILGVRAANQIMLKRGARPDELIELAFMPDKGTDQEVSVRAGNAGRLDDPPYVSAKNAARLLSRGKSLEQISAIMCAEISTVRSWIHYLDLDPQIQRLIEDPEVADEERIPFSVGVELARGSGSGKPGTGKGEGAAQVLALDYLRKIGAPLKGERGRENAKAAIRGVKGGDITRAMLEGMDLVLNAPPKAGSNPGLPAPPTASPEPVPAAQEAKEREPAPARAPRGKSPRIQARDQKLSWGAIRELGGHFEPGKSAESTEAELLIYRFTQVLLGHDPGAENLSDWPEIQQKLRRVVRSPKAEAEQ